MQHPENIALRRTAQGELTLQDFSPADPVETVQVPIPTRQMLALCRQKRIPVHQVFPCSHCQRPVALIRILGSDRVRLVDATLETSKEQNPYSFSDLWSAELFGDSHECSVPPEVVQ